MGQTTRSRAWSATSKVPALALAVLLAVAVALGAAGCREVGRSGGEGGGEVGEGRAPLLVFAAASLENVMTEVAAAYSRAGDGEVELNAAGSNVLAQQIRAGAPADVFVSADARWVDDLVRDGLLVGATRRELLGNRLVVIAHPDAGLSLARLEDLGALDFRHLSVADPDSVPAGRYARSLLESTSVDGGGTVWAQVADRLAPAPDVRAALALVAAEPAAVGIVYATDLGATRGVEVLLEVEREPEPPIRYVAAVVRREDGEADGDRRTAEAGRFLDFLGSDEARAIFVRHGFRPVFQRRTSPRWRRQRAR
jgi:molybdate transport system substrate-binding protein